MDHSCGMFVAYNDMVRAMQMHSSLNSIIAVNVRSVSLKTHGTELSS